MGWSESFKDLGSRDLFLKMSSNLGEDTEEIHPDLRVQVSVVQSTRVDLLLGHTAYTQTFFICYK